VHDATNRVRSPLNQQVNVIGHKHVRVDRCVVLRAALDQALKVAAFTATPTWIAGVFNIIPSLSIIGSLLSLYSLYLLFVGLPILMKPPEDKALPYFVVVILAAIVLSVVFFVVASLAIPGPVRGF